jgi:hypothetical protein
MKTSSLILIILTATCLLVVLSVPVIVRHNLNSGNYKRIDSDQTFDYDRQSFEGIDAISLENLESCTIVPSNSLMIDIEKSEKNENVVNIESGTLVVRNQPSTQFRIRIFVPRKIRIKAKACNILLKGTLNSFDSMKTDITLINSRVRIRSIFKDDKIEQFWDRLALTGVDSSEVEILDAVAINRLELKNISSVKMSSRVYVNKMQTWYDVNKRISSFSDDDGLTIKTY